MKLDREHQQMLFEVRPDTFAPCKLNHTGERRQSRSGHVWRRRLLRDRKALG